jgi:hypothetical protein
VAAKSIFKRIYLYWRIINHLRINKCSSLFNELIEYYLDQNQPDLAQLLTVKAGFEFAGKPEEVILLDRLKVRMENSQFPFIFYQSLLRPSDTTSTPYELEFI